MAACRSGARSSSNLAVRTVVTAVVAAMVVGLAIALLQALTQVQEITLTFIPKILAIFVSVAFSATFIGAQMGRLSNSVYSHIQSGF